MLIGISIFIGLIIVWMIYSRYSINKEIGIELDMAQKDLPINTNIPPKEFARYASKHNLRCNVVMGVAIIEYDNKNIMVAQKDGQTFVYISEE